MILVDANLLLYAYDPDATQHDASRRWLEEDALGPRPREVYMADALGIRAHRDEPTGLRGADVGSGSRMPPSRPGSRSRMRASSSPASGTWNCCGTLLETGQAAGPLVMDAVLAAIAIEHGATLCSTDRDFSRFAGLDWRNPLDRAS